MSELDLLIAMAAKELNDANESVIQACEKTLKDYHSAADEQQEGSGPRLRMIAWDRS